MARVLIIDDDNDVRDALPRVLERANHDVEVCGDGQTALGLCRSWDPDLVVTDVFMPEMDGIEFMLRLLDERPDLPVIVISGGARTIGPHLALDDATHLGAISTLAKPFQMDEFLAAVGAALSPEADGLIALCASLRG